MAIKTVTPPSMHHSVLFKPKPDLDNTYPVNPVRITEPQKPSQVLLGESLSNNFLLPVVLPTTKAQVSEDHINMRRPKSNLYSSTMA